MLLPPGGYKQHHFAVLGQPLFTPCRFSARMDPRITFPFQTHSNSTVAAEMDKTTQACFGAAFICFLYEH